MSRTPDIHLSTHEQALLEKIHFHWTSHDQLKSSLEPMAALSKSLLDRNAIPAIRLRYLNDPEFNPEGYGNSRQDMFEQDSACYGEILRHPHFLLYLEYFVFGPRLPLTVIRQFKEAAKFSGYPTAGDLDDLVSTAKRLCCTNRPRSAV